MNWGPALYRLAKALWFKHLDPEIPQQTLVQEVEEEEQALDKGVEEEEEEEYDEYDENTYEDDEDAERGGGDRCNRKAAAAYEEDYLEESVVLGPNHGGEYDFGVDARQEVGGEYAYEADEEGEDWEEEEEGDYEDNGEANAEYEGVYQGGYYDQGLNQDGYFGGTYHNQGGDYDQGGNYEGANNQADYYAAAGANNFNGTNNLYEDVY